MHPWCDVGVCDMKQNTRAYTYTESTTPYIAMAFTKFTYASLIKHGASDKRRNV